MRFISAFLVSAFLAFAPAAPLLAQVATPNQTATLPAPAPGKIENPAIGQTPIGMAHVSVSAGSIAGDVLTWAAAVIGAPLAAFLVVLGLKLLKKWGVEVSDADRARAQEFIRNGIALAAQEAKKKIDGTMTFGVRDEIAQRALKYAQEHGAETLKRLGAPDPNDPKVIEALQARIAKELDDLAAKVA